MNRIKLFPTQANALNIAHPVDGKLKAEGSDWTDDSFTARMRSDGIVTTDESKAWKPDAAEKPKGPEGDTPASGKNPDRK